MKLNDKYFCIKKLGDYNYEYEIDKIYTILSIRSTETVCVSIDNDIFDIKYLYFSLFTDGEYRYFYDYFIDIRGYRKLKLNKLCSK